MQKNAYFGLFIVMAILAVLPFVLPNSFYVDLVIRMAINAVIVLGLNLLIGCTGRLGCASHFQAQGALSGDGDARTGHHHQHRAA